MGHKETLGVQIYVHYLDCDDCFMGVSVQFSSVAQLCLTLCDPMNCSMPGLRPSPTPRVYSNSCPSSR